ncbi:MAG: hypothetical protein N4A44_00805 [Alphaproteobacteria bacterium]|jgi:ABC-type polysaccharide/polyol phosphate export permease|nr:hypothetical protein [Alphaproteobacteria bacterium]
MAGALTFGSIAALFIGDVLQFVFSVTSIVYIFAPIFLLTAMGKFKKSERLDKAVTINMAVNTVIYFYMFTGGYFKEFINTAIPAGTSLIGILICLTFFNKETKVKKVKVN